MLVTSSVWFIITSILVSNISDRHKVVVMKRAGDMVLFKTSTGILKPGLLAADWIKGDKYIIVEGIKQHYVPYVVRAESVEP
jgi:hypothetical protein